MPIDPKRVQELFLQLVELPTTERAAALARLEAVEAELCRRVQALLVAHDQPDSFLDATGMPFAATIDQSATSAFGTPESLGQSADKGPAQPELGATFALPTVTPSGSAPHWQARTEEMIAGRYLLESKLGEGGMGEVWVAQQTEPVRRKVALKLIKTGTDSRAVLARFEHERQALALMDHPNIARVLDGGLTPAGQPFFVMELVHGQPLTTYCDQARLTPKDRLELFVQVCQAIQHAHQKGIIHRDIKPGNVLVTEVDGRPMPKVIDFGVAKATEQKLTDQTFDDTGLIVGTPSYMSPEQADPSCLDIDTRTDVYALGVLLYELLAGSPPIDASQFKRGAIMEMLRMVREEEPPRPSTKVSTSEGLPNIAAARRVEPAQLKNWLRGDVDWIVMKALEKDRGRRYESAIGFAQDIQRYLAHEPVQAAPPSRSYRIKKFVRKHRGPVLAASLLLLAVLAGTAGTTVGLFQARAARDAEAEQKKKAQDAAAAEHAALVSAQKRLEQVEKGNLILTTIFDDLDITKVRANKQSLESVLAERLVRASDQLDEQAVGDPLLTAYMRGRLGKSLTSLGFQDKAVPLHQKALEEIRKAKGEDHPDTMATMMNLGQALELSGELTTARQIYDQTLQMRKEKLGPLHASTLLSMIDLAQLQKRLGRYDLAVPLLEDCLVKLKATLGDDHQYTVGCQRNLAEAYSHLGRHADAVPMLENSLKHARETIGNEHPFTLNYLNSLAAAYFNTGRIDEALPLFEEALKLQQSLLGRDHLDTLASMNNLGITYRVQGKHELAIGLLEEALRLEKSKLGMNHTFTMNTMHQLGVAYSESDKHDQALPLMDESLRLLQASLGHDHPTVLINLSGLGKAYLSANRLDDAEKTLKQFIAAERKKSGANSEAYTGLILAISLDVLKARHFAFAEELLREWLENREPPAAEAWTKYQVKALLGSALLEQKKYPEAEEELLTGYEGMKQREQSMPLPARNGLNEAAGWLVQLYEALGKPKEAARWRERSKQSQR